VRLKSTASCAAGCSKPSIAPRWRLSSTRPDCRYAREVSVPATYKGQLLGSYRIDFIVEDLVIVEVKSVERMNPVFETQVLTYLGMTGKRVGLLINFNSRLLKDGVQRIIR
jgi:GxxExxY protein